MATLRSLLVMVVLLRYRADAGSSWTQQYGDGASSNYVPYQGSVGEGWFYLSQRAAGSYSNPPNPCVTDDGTLFYPLQSRVLAISTEGKVLREYDVQQSDAEYYLEASNTLYSSRHDTVLVAAAGDTSNQGSGRELTRISALDITSATIKWSVDGSKYRASHPISLSDASDSLFVARGKDITAFSLTDGNVKWSQDIGAEIDWPIPLKVGTLPSGQEVLLYALVPGVNNGVINLLDTVTGTVLWNKTLWFGSESSFAISSKGIIYGCTALFPSNPNGTKQIMTLDAATGRVLYSGMGYCTDTSQRPMAPSTDGAGNGYYSCGNQVFSISSNGNLRWRSVVHGRETLPPHLAPSIHPDGTLYYVTTDQSSIVAMATKDGSVMKTYGGVKDVQISQPPILVGRDYMYILGLAEHSTVYVYPLRR